MLFICALVRAGANKQYSLKKVCYSLINMTIVSLWLGNTHGIALWINIKRLRPVTLKIALFAPSQDIAKEVPRLSIQWSNIFRDRNGCTSALRCDDYHIEQVRGIIISRIDGHRIWTAHALCRPAIVIVPPTIRIVAPDTMPRHFHILGNRKPWHLVDKEDWCSELLSGRSL